MINLVTDQKGHRDLSGHKVCHRDIYWPCDLLGHKLGRTGLKGNSELKGTKVTATSNDPLAFWSHKLGQTDRKGHCDPWDHLVGHGDVSSHYDLSGSKLCQTDQKGRRDIGGHKVGDGNVSCHYDILGSSTRSN